jgi:hypothetical protein
MKDEIKKAIIKWDNKYFSSLIEEEIESLANFIFKYLQKKNKRNFKITGDK